MIYSLLLYFLFIGSTAACSCLPLPSLSQDFARTPVIFIGRVVNKVPSKTPYDDAKYVMKVEEAFKGTSLAALVQVHTSPFTTVCGLGDIPIGSRWQIWLDTDGEANTCTRTTSNINADRKKLRRLAKGSSFEKRFP